MNLLPVAIGGDIGIYALLRDFHTQYGCDAVVLSTNPTRAIGHSSFITNVVNEGINDPATLAQTLITIAHEHPGRTLILLTNADWYVKAILDHRNELAKHYIIPHPPKKTSTSSATNTRSPQSATAYPSPHPQKSQSTFPTSPKRKSPPS